MSQYERLLDNLTSLKLNEMRDYLNEVNQFITTNKLSFYEGLLKLTDYQIEIRRKNMETAMVKVAGFPHFKEIETFDFSFQENLDEAQIRSFFSHAFIHEKENIVFVGSCGVGKTHLATSIGISVAKSRLSTYFIKCHDLVLQLKRAHIENRLEDRLRHFTKYKLLIIDEFGYLPLKEDEAKLLFQLIDRRYEKKSTIITTNVSFSKWDKVLNDPLIASAIIDRLLHHSHIVKIIGPSYRLKNLIESEEK